MFIWIVCASLGEWVVFYQNLVHEVVSRRRAHRTVRIFAGFRLTRLNEPLFPDNAQAYADFGVPKIPSGQTPHMYSANHWSFPKNRATLVSWSKQTFIDSVLETRVVKTTNEACQVVPVVCPSLRALGKHDVYPPYSAADLAILSPVRLF